MPRFREGAVDRKVRCRCRVCGTLLAIHRPNRNPLAEDEESDGNNRDQSFHLPGYELLGELGRGGMGVVYSAVRLLDKELVAIKVLPPECARYPELINRFDLEAQMMATLTHPSIVPILDRGQMGNHSYIVMDYIPGCNLKHRIHKAAPLSIEEVVAIATPVSEAIQCCHEIGLVHRDLKPANVLLSQLGQVQVTDFGIANLIQRLGHQTEFGVMIGTPQYVAPEQMKDGSKVDTRADQYSLAVIMYEMLTGMLPVGVFELASKTCDELTAEAEAALMKALARNSQDRFESMRQFLRAFRRGLNLPEDRTLPENLIRAAAASSSACIITDSGNADSPVEVNILADDWAKTYEDMSAPTEDESSVIEDDEPSSVNLSFNDSQDEIEYRIEGEDPIEEEAEEEEEDFSEDDMEDEETDLPPPNRDEDSDGAPIDPPSGAMPDPPSSTPNPLSSEATAPQPFSSFYIATLSGVILALILVLVYLIIRVVT